MGQPFLGQAQPGAAYPLNWLLWLMPQQNGLIQMWAINWYFVVVHYMAALFCYLLCRDLGRSRAASMIAGLAFALAGYVGGVDWPQMVNGAVWTPLVFLFLLRAVRGMHPWASASLSGACIGMAWLSGHHQVPIFLTLAAAGAWLYYILKDGGPDWRMARLAAIAMVFAPLVGALQILPAQEYGRLAWRWAGARDHLGWDDVIPYYVHTQHAVRPIYLFGILIPGYGEIGVFFGVVAVSFALIAVTVMWRQHFVKFFGAIALGGLIYSLGSFSIFQGFIYAVIPFVEKARVPAAAMLLFDAGFAVLAAFGVEALQGSTEPEEPGSLWIRRINIGVAAFGIVLCATVLAVLLSRRFQWDFDERVAMTVLISILMAALLYAWRTHSLTRRQALILATLLLLFEAGNQASFMLADRNDSNRRTYLDRIWGNRDIADFLQKQPGPFRVETHAEEDISRNWGDFNNLDFPTAMAGVTVNAFRLETYNPSTKKLLGTKYTLARAATNPAQSEVFRGSSGVAVYENPDVFSRAWAVHEIVPIRNAGQGQAFIDEHVNEMRRKAVFVGESPPRVPACPEAKDTVFVTNYKPANVSINADMTCSGMVVLSDTYYPGWYASVDGQPTPIYEVDLALRGVPVPQGAHVVNFQYRPRSVFWGACLTLTGVFGAAVIAFFSGKNRRLAPKHHH